MSEPQPGTLAWLVEPRRSSILLGATLAVAVLQVAILSWLTRDATGLTGLAPVQAVPTALIGLAGYVLLARLTPDRGPRFWAGLLAATYTVGVVVSFLLGSLEGAWAAPQVRYRLAAALGWPSNVLVEALFSLA